MKPENNVSYQQILASLQKAILSFQSCEYGCLLLRVCIDHTSAQNCVGSWLGGEVGGGGEVGADTNECDLTATGWLAARQTFQIMNGGARGPPEPLETGLELPKICYSSGLSQSSLE